MLRVLDLFSGIGAFSLGLERAGMHTAAFCERNPFCRKVLAKHWPEVPCFEDVRTLQAEQLSDIDVICAGWPCQDLSLAGAGAGLGGANSGLWWELVRTVRLVRPRWVLLENVAELLGRGMGEVVGSLAASGYDSEYDCIPACAISANHERDRAWVIAYDRRVRLEVGQRIFSRGQVADAAAKTSGQWDDLSEVGRAVHGVANRVDRITAIGNTLLPQIAEMIGRAVLAVDNTEGDCPSFGRA